jgi:hypothetical protein
MSDLEFLLVLGWILIGLISIVWGLSLFQGNRRRRHILLSNEIELAENTLFNDLEKIGIMELAQTQAGREIIELTERMRVSPSHRPRARTTSVRSDSRQTESQEQTKLPVDVDADKAYLKELHQILSEHFSMDELLMLCFDLGVDIDALLGAGKEEKVRELIAYCRRRDRIAHLAYEAVKLRPEFLWPKMPETMRLEQRQLRALILHPAAETWSLTRKERSQPTQLQSSASPIIIKAIPGESEVEFSSRVFKEYEGLDGTIEMVFRSGLPDFAIIKLSVMSN